MTAVTSIDERDGAAVAARLAEAAAAMREAPNRRGSVSMIEGSGRLLVTGDLHDNPQNLAKLVRHASLDRNLEDHLVLQELIHGDQLNDGVDLSYRMLVKVAGLVLAHPTRVHVLLANHELAQMAGHSVSKGGGCMTTQFDQGLMRAFGSDADLVATAVGEFVRAMPLAARTSNGVLCAHSLPGPAMMPNFDLEILDRDLVDADYEPLHGSAWMMVWGRGQADVQTEKIAREWDVSLFCLGHAFVEDGVAIGGPRTILLNSDHERGAVLPLNLADPSPTVESAMFAAFPIASIEPSV